MTPDELAKILAKPGYSIAGGKAPGPVVERDLRDGPLAKGEGEEGHSGRFHVHVVSYRRRLLDEDNLAEKWHVDALRYSGCLPSDAPGKAKITVSQEKVKRKEDERTEILITPL